MDTADAQRIALPWKCKLPLPPPTMNLSLVIMMRTEPVAAWDSVGAPAKIAIAWALFSFPTNHVEIITQFRRLRGTASEKVRMVEETFEPGMMVNLVASARRGAEPAVHADWSLKGSLTAAGSGEEVVPDRSIHRPRRRAGNAIDSKPRLLEQTIEHAPSKCPMRATALQRNIDKDGIASDGCLPAVRQAILELIAQPPKQRCPHCQKWIRNNQQRE